MFLAIITPPLVTVQNLCQLNLLGSWTPPSYVSQLSAFVSPHHLHSLAGQIICEWYMNCLPYGPFKIIKSCEHFGELCWISLIHPLPPPCLDVFPNHGRQTKILASPAYTYTKKTRKKRPKEFTFLLQNTKGSLPKKYLNVNFFQKGGRGLIPKFTFLTQSTKAELHWWTFLFLITRY